MTRPKKRKRDQQRQRESRYVRVARIAYAMAQETLPKYSHPKSPHIYTLPQLAACVLLGFYLDLSYRDLEEWLWATDRVLEVLELKRVPDHTTLYRTYRKLRMEDWERMRRALLAKLGVEGEEGVIAADSTGFRLTQASAYYQSRTGRTYKEWVKGVYAVGIQTQTQLANPGLADGEGAWERCALSFWAHQGDPALWAQGGRGAGLAAFGRQRLRWCSGRRGGPGPSHPAGREPAGPKAAGTGGACGSGPVGWALWTAMDLRDGAVGDQAEVWGDDPVAQALSAAEGAGGQGVGL